LAIFLSFLNKAQFQSDHHVYYSGDKTLFFLFDHLVINLRRAEGSGECRNLSGDLLAVVEEK